MIAFGRLFRFAKNYYVLRSTRSTVAASMVVSVTPHLHPYVLKRADAEAKRIGHDTVYNATTLPNNRRK